MSQTKTTPEVLWAQRSSTTDAEKNYIYLTISAPDAPKIDVDLKPTSLTFTGHSDTKKTTYHVELEFFGEIDVENSKTNHTTRDVEFVLRKKELKEEYWPRLLKESKKVHFLKTDFDKWVDEDEQNAAPDDADLGPSNGGGGMPGMGGDGGFGGIDFSKLGGMGGPDSMEGLGDIDDGAGGDDGEDDDDDEIPGLEDEESAEKSETAAEEAKHEPSAASSKTEEATGASASKKIEELS